MKTTPVTHAELRMKSPVRLIWNGHNQPVLYESLYDAISVIRSNAFPSPLDKWELQNKFAKYLYNKDTDDISVLVIY